MASEGQVSRRFVVRGRVQGVGFRDFVYRSVWKLGGVLGHVRNLRDGSVEVCVTADAGKVEAIVGFLRRGPPLARVDGIEEGPFEPAGPPGPFTVLFGG